MDCHFSATGKPKENQVVRAREGAAQSQNVEGGVSDPSEDAEYAVG